MTEIISKQVAFWQGSLLAQPTAILFSGKAGVGKSTSAKLAKEIVLNDYKIDAMLDSFARPVKQIAMEYFGWDGNKESHGRDLLQKVGCYGREIDSGVWARYIANSHGSTELLIIDDWRYPNETKVLADNFINVISVRVSAPEREILKGTTYYGDISETSLDNYTFNYTINNSGSIANLKYELSDILKIIFGQMKG